MKHQIEDKGQLEGILSPKPQESKGFEKLKDYFVTGITPYYASLMQPELGNNQDCPIRLQAMPRTEESSDSIGVADPLGEVPQLPVKEVVHVYPDRVAFCVAIAMSCLLSILLLKDGMRRWASISIGKSSIRVSSI